MRNHIQSITALFLFWVDKPVGVRRRCPLKLPRGCLTTKGFRVFLLKLGPMPRRGKPVPAPVVEATPFFFDVFPFIPREGKHLVLVFYVNTSNLPTVKNL